MLSGEMQDSVPPQTIAVAAPWRIKLVASPGKKIRNNNMLIYNTDSNLPIEWAPVAQAVETEWFGPSNPCLMLIIPAAMLVKILGTK